MKIHPVEHVFARADKTEEGKEFIRTEFLWHDAESALVGLSDISRRGGAPRDHWFGGSFDHCRNVLTNGDVSRIEEANKLLEQTLDNVALETSDVSLELQPVGYAPCVGAYCAGEPECMYGQGFEDSEIAPIRVYVDLTTSQGISADTIMRKGVALVALFMTLQRIRPVELWIGGSSKPKRGSNRQDVLVLSKVGATPIDLGQLGAALWFPGTPRRLMYSIVFDVTGTSARALGWPEHSFVDMVKPEPTDLVVSGLHMDKLAECSADPVQWINGQVELALSRQSEAYKVQTN